MVHVNITLERLKLNKSLGIVMAWVAVNENEDEYIFEAMPERCFGCQWIPTFCESQDRIYDSIKLPKGSIKKLIGRELSFTDEPVELG